jgi:hypothetical protein
LRTRLVIYPQIGSVLGENYDGTSIIYYDKKLMHVAGMDELRLRELDCV